MYCLWTYRFAPQILLYHDILSFFLQFYLIIRFLTEFEPNSKEKGAIF